MSITIFFAMYLGVVTDPEAVKDNDFDEVVDPRESLDKFEEGVILKPCGPFFGHFLPPLPPCGLTWTFE